MTTKEEKERSFASKAGEFAGGAYGATRKQVDKVNKMDAAVVEARKPIEGTGSKLRGDLKSAAMEFGSGFANANEAAFPSPPQVGPNTYSDGSPRPAEPAPAAKSAVAPVSPAAEAPKVNKGMPEPQPAEIMADAQGYMPQDYVQPGMLARPDSGPGARQGAGASGASFSTVSGPQNDLSVAAQFNKQADMLASQNARKEPAVRSNNAIAGYMGGGGNIGVGRQGGGIQKQIGRLLSSMPYGSAGDRAKRNSILKQADIMMKGYTADQRTQQQGMQFDQEMAFKEGNAATMAEQYAMGYAQKENQFGQEMDFKRQQAMQNQGNTGNQLALDYYKADKMAVKESMPFRSFTEDDNEGNSTAMVIDQRTGATRPATSPVNEERNMMIKNINDGVKSKKYTEEEGERMFEMMGATRKK